MVIAMVGGYTNHSYSKYWLIAMARKASVSSRSLQGASRARNFKRRKK